MKKLVALILSLCMLLGMIPAMAETGTEAPAETKQVDVKHLIDQVLNDIGNAVIKVDVADAKANGATMDATQGTAFTILKNVLSNAAAAMAKQGKEDENLNKLIAILNDPEAMKDSSEEEVEVLSALVLLALTADAEEREEDAAITMMVVNSILKAVYDGCKENEILTAAIKATDSRLFEMLDETNSVMKDFVEKNGALVIAALDVDDKAFAEFEAEIQKLKDYLNGIEGNKQTALDLLDLLHAVMDDIHEAIDGHPHEDAEEVDHGQLIVRMLDQLGEAIEKVNLDDVREKAGESFNITGSVYAVYEKVVLNILADEEAKEKESEENLKKILETIGRLDAQDVTEEEAEALFALMFLGAEAAEQEAENVDPEMDFLRATHIMKAVYDTMLENETIQEALKATGSRLPEMLVNSGERLKKYAEENGTLHKVKDVDEAPFVAFEAEFAKLREHIAGLEDGTPGKAKGLGVLDLLHQYVDDIHDAVDGHAHAEAEAAK